MENTNKKCMLCSCECKQKNNILVIRCYKFQKNIDNVIKNYNIGREENKKARLNVLN